MGNRQKEERLPLWFVCAFIWKPCENTLVGYTNYIDYTFTHDFDAYLYNAGLSGLMLFTITSAPVI